MENLYTVLLDRCSHSGGNIVREIARAEIRSDPEFAWQRLLDWLRVQTTEARLAAINSDLRIHFSIARPLIEKNPHLCK